MGVRWLFFIAPFFSLLAMPVSTRDAGEAAKKKEPQKRRPATPAKAYTDTDLEKYRPAPPAPEPGTGSSSAGPTGLAVAAPRPPSGPQLPRGDGQPPAESSRPAAKRQRQGEGGEGGVPASPDEPSVTDGLPDPASGGEEDTGSAELLWRARADELRSAASQAQSTLDGLEVRLAGLRNDTGQDRLSDPLRLQSIQAEIETVTPELEQAKADLAAARKALEDFEEEARRANIPPGWTRERPEGSES